MKDIYVRQNLAEQLRQLVDKLDEIGENLAAVHVVRAEEILRSSGPADKIAKARRFDPAGDPQQA